MKCPVCPGRVNHPKGLKGIGEGFCPRQDEIKAFLNKKYPSGRPNFDRGRDRGGAEQAKPGAKDKIDEMLAAQSAHAAVTQGADLLGMFRKGAVAIKHTNLAIIHTEGSVEFAVAKWVAGILQLIFVGWCIYGLSYLLACDIQRVQGVLNVMAFFTVGFLLYHVMGRPEATQHQMLGMAAKKIVHTYSSVFLNKLAGAKYYFDTGALICIIRDINCLSNIRDIPAVELQGATGTCLITKMGDVTMSVKTTTVAYYPLTITNVLFNPLSPVNLISAKQMNDFMNCSVHMNVKVGNVVLNTDEGEVWLELEIQDGIYAFVTLITEAPSA